MKHMKKALALVLVAMMILALNVTALAEEPATTTPATHRVSTSSTTHTYEIYQVFTGTNKDGQLTNLKYGQNATGTNGESVSATDMAALATIAGTTYATDQAKITALTPYVNLNSEPIATIGKGADSSADLAEGYYIIKDKDKSLSDPETYTLYLFEVLNADLTIDPKSGTTTVNKDVTETNDSTGATTAGQNGADYDVGDSIPYVITVKLAENVTDYKTYTVTLTDTLSTGLTPPAQDAITVTFKDKAGADITAFGTPVVAVDGQKITVTYTVKGNETDATVAIGNRTGSAALNEAVITVSYNAVLNDHAVTGVAGNPNTYTITYSNNPNGNDTGKTPDQKVTVYTYELTIEKVDGNGEPLQGAGFTLYKKITVPEGGTAPEGAKLGSEIKAGLAKGVDASKLVDNTYYVPVTLTETVNSTTGKVTHKTDKDIDAGEYVLIETTVPAGYNAYAGENITITSTIDAEGNLTGLTATPNTLTVASDLSGAEGKVENESGAVLPTTGGIGTTIFYVVGGILLLGACVILVAKRRVDAK